jgi:hypothetical protein
VDLLRTAQASVVDQDRLHHIPDVVQAIDQVVNSGMPGCLRVECRLPRLSFLYQIVQ